MSDTRTTLAALITFALISISVSSACNREDEKALLSIMGSLPPNSFPSTWNSSDDCCTWDYISCTAGRVTILQITDTDKLSGPIPPSIARLSSLQFLILSNLPNLAGPIPRQLVRLRNLQFFIISNTSISGPVPSFLSKLPQLVAVNLNGNKLSGPIPASLGHSQGLSLLYLDGNRLTGTIPNTLFSRAINTSIQLDLSNNELTGPIPPSFGYLRFISIDLSNNKLTGDASFLFGKSKKAADIILSRNMLSFDLTNVDYPEHLFVQRLDISHNEIYGSISGQINRVQDLEYFDASFNRLCGKIPGGKILGQFNSSFFAHNDCLCGSPLPPCK